MSDQAQIRMGAERKQEKKNLLAMMVKASGFQQLNDEINSDMEKIRTHVQKEEQKLVQDIQKMTPEEAKENVRIMYGKNI